MERITTFIQENLDGYNLPANDLVEIRGLLLRRFGEKFSEGLSPEGRQAMEQAAKREVESAANLYRLKGGTIEDIIDTHAANDKSESIVDDDSFTGTNELKLDDEFSEAIELSKKECKYLNENTSNSNDNLLHQ